MRLKTFVRKFRLYRSIGLRFGVSLRTAWRMSK